MNLTVSFCIHCHYIILYQMQFQQLYFDHRNLKYDCLKRKLKRKYMNGHNSSFDDRNIIVETAFVKEL